MTPAASSRISAIRPLWAVEGGRVTIAGEGFLAGGVPEVRFGTAAAGIACASDVELAVIVPSGLDGGRTPVRVSSAPGETAYVEIGAPVATGLHQVDNPAFDPEGNLYVTFSGSRGQQAPVSIYLVRQDGTREPFVTDLPNPTSMTFGPDGHLYVSSRFDGSVHRILRDGSVTTYASDLGVACGIAFGPDGLLYVGDRSGSILRVENGRARPIATLPASVAAFHLAFGPDGHLYVTAPTLSSRDVVYRITLEGRVEVFADGFGRPQGVAFDAEGRLHVVDALAGDAGVFRLPATGTRGRERLVSGGALIGLAFDSSGGTVLASSETVYRFPAAPDPAV